MLSAFTSISCLKKIQKLKSLLKAGTSMWDGKRSPFFGILFCLSFSLVLILTSCLPLSPPQLQPLKIGITDWPGSDIILYAQAEDIFKQKGLEVELVRFENLQDSSRAVIRGAIDAAFVNLWDVLQIDPRDDQPVIVLITNVSFGSDGIVAQAPIKTIKDLKNKRVAAKLGVVNHLILLEALKKHNINPTDVQIEDVSNETAVQRMEEKQVDAAVLWQPLLSETAKKVQGNVIHTTKELDSLIIDTLITGKKNIDNKRAELIQFLSVWLDVMEAVEKKPKEVYTKVAQLLKQSPEAFARDYSGLKKGDIDMQKQLLLDQNNLKEAMRQMKELLAADPRSGRLPRQDIEINGELVKIAIAGWKQ